jgi:MoaA/NifB/PqqE/SkfB family radical SAM enzyme
VLSWNFLAFDHNIHELPLAMKRARELGVNEFRVVNPFDVGWDDPAFRPAPVKGRVHRLDLLPTSIGLENWNPFPESLDRESISRAYETPWDTAATESSSGGSGHTCHWLYKNVVMDANGRIMPCCGAPKQDGSLVFDRLEANGGEVFNSPKYREARAWFSSGKVSSDNPPFCTKCEWDHTAVNVGGREIRTYFRAASASFFDRRSRRLLSDW